MCRIRGSTGVYNAWVRPDAASQRHRSKSHMFEDGRGTKVAAGWQPLWGREGPAPGCGEIGMRPQLGT